MSGLFRSLPRRRRALAALLPLLAVLASGALPCHSHPAGVAHASSATATPGVPEVTVRLSEWSLSPGRVAVLAGQATRLVAANDGALPHALAVEGDGFYVESETIGSDQSAVMEVIFPAPGIYDLFCPIGLGQHRLLGQDGTLIVTTDLAAATAGDELALTALPSAVPAAPEAPLSAAIPPEAPAPDAAPAETVLAEAPPAEAPPPVPVPEPALAGAGTP
ncbi:MAG TPA: hypothetical protein VHS99_16965 [Chloroflexota bacterium]|jgi:plastocyanin|nr:hypothetical protein [Chloroflexota bacterium]